jgi:starch synthase
MMRNPRAIRGQGSRIIVKATLPTSKAHITRLTTICRASGKSKGDDDAIARLQQENLLLRQALAQYQGCNPSEVTIEIDKEEPSTPSPKSKQKQPRSTTPKKPTAAAISSGINWPSPSEDRFWERDAHSSPFTLPPSSSNTQSPDQDPSPLHIMHISAEMAPVAKVGGLGDVVPGLAKACLDTGHQVEIVLPFYQCIPDSAIQDLQHVLEMQVPKGRFQDGVMHGGSLKTHFFKGVIDGCPVILVRPDWEQSNLFKGDRIYGGSYNEAEAYLFFSRAALEYIKVSGCQPNVVHCHEWQTSAVPMLFWEKVVVNMPSTRLILTIHNFDSPGECRQDEFAATGVGGDLFNTIDKA